jgi:hypothetical protein
MKDEIVGHGEKKDEEVGEAESKDTYAEYSSRMCDENRYLVISFLCDSPR